jgi:retron-type reverse transcriptase
LSVICTCENVDNALCFCIYMRIKILYIHTYVLYIHTYDDKKLTALISLDISAAFDTISHDTLLNRLETEFGVDGISLSWLRSYLTNRSQFVKLGRHSSKTVACCSGVPQGSVLGPLLFVVYVSPVSDVIKCHEVSHRQYADDRGATTVSKLGGSNT